MLLLCQLPDAMATAATTCMPHHLCDFAYRLAQTFNVFYNACNILKEENQVLQASWLALCGVCLREFEVVVNLLGIEIPERM